MLQIVDMISINLLLANKQKTRLSVHSAPARFSHELN